MNYRRNIYLQIFVLFFLRILHSQPDFYNLDRQLSVLTTSPHAQIEIGGPFVGIELHQGAPLINRISFFYPVANSLDLSTDYWKRDQFHVQFYGLKIGEHPKVWLKNLDWSYEQTPYRAQFYSEHQGCPLKISYHFCQNKPAMIIRIEIVNNTSHSTDVEFYSHLETSLRTCHTYSLIDKAWTSFDSTVSAISAHFENSSAHKPAVIVANAGDLPQSFSSRSQTLANPDSSVNYWISKTSDLPNELIPAGKEERPTAAYIYKKQLAPGERLEIVQIIASCYQNEAEELIQYLLKNYQHEVRQYEQSVLKYAFLENTLTTGDSMLDHSIHWAKAILAVNRHWLDGALVPMPCPAEYNFFFTHDVLLTDLAAVYFDLPRVKHDLEFIKAHIAPDGKIPHAYYWKDDRYVTEYADADNWNNFWFILVAAEYLRRSQDFSLTETIYPIMTNCLQLTLQNRRDDNLLWAYRPDWWDIGRKFGPRAYMTILQINALREYIYVSQLLKRNPDKLADYEQIAAAMQKALNDKLWREDKQFLMNGFEDGIWDDHYYIGSLLAAHFGLLNKERLGQLIQTSQTYLLDEQLGIYNAWPMDFHRLIDFWKFSDNEAGDPFYYLNGGIWAHGNAWYALSLIANGQRQDALDFIKQTMTIRGVKAGPNGQPAMFEYRIGDKSNPALYGRVDKPQFMWAAGWYLYCIYQLFPQ